MPYNHGENGLCKDVERPQVTAPGRPTRQRSRSAHSSPRDYPRYHHHSTLLLYRIFWDMLQANNILSTQSTSTITPYEQNSENAAAASRTHNRHHHTPCIPPIHIPSPHASLISPEVISPSPLRPRVPQAFPLDIQQVPILAIRGPMLARLALLGYRWGRHRARMTGDADMRHRRWIRIIVAC